MRRFLEWAEHEGIEDIAELDPFHGHDFKLYRREHAGVNEVTFYNNLCTLRVLVKWPEFMEVIEQSISEEMFAAPRSPMPPLRKRSRGSEMTTILPSGD